MIELTKEEIEYWDFDKRRCESYICSKLATHHFKGNIFVNHYCDDHFPEAKKRRNKEIEYARYWHFDDDYFIRCFNISCKYLRQKIDDTTYCGLKKPKIELQERGYRCGDFLK